MTRRAEEEKMQDPFCVPPVSLSCHDAKNELFDDSKKEKKNQLRTLQEKTIINPQQKKTNKNQQQKNKKKKPQQKNQKKKPQQSPKIQKPLQKQLQ